MTGGGLKARLGDVDGWLEDLYSCRLLSEPSVRNLCSAARDVLVQESNVKHVRSDRYHTTTHHHTTPHHTVPHYITPPYKSDQTTHHGVKS